MTALFRLVTAALMRSVEISPVSDGSIDVEPSVNPFLSLDNAELLFRYTGTGASGVEK
ncbi:hypothetical protein D3C81_2206580 [compost metagenome]